MDIRILETTTEWIILTGDVVIKCSHDKFETADECYVAFCNTFGESEEDITVETAKADREQYQKEHPDGPPKEDNFEATTALLRTMQHIASVVTKAKKHVDAEEKSAGHKSTVIH